MAADIYNGLNLSEPKAIEESMGRERRKEKERKIAIGLDSPWNIVARPYAINTEQFVSVTYANLHVRRWQIATRLRLLLYRTCTTITCLVTPLTTILYTVSQKKLCECEPLQQCCFAQRCKIQAKHDKGGDKVDKVKTIIKFKDYVRSVLPSHEHKL